MKGMTLILMVLFLPCLFGQEIGLAMGDLNRDGVVDAADMVVLANYQAGNLSTLFEAGDLYQVDTIVGMLRYVPAGTFNQGLSTDEPCSTSGAEPFIHSLSKNLAVMQTEVTRRMWAALKVRQMSLPADPTDVSWGAGMTNPVQSVTWYEAVFFANLLSEEKGLARCYYTDAAFTVPIDATNYTSGPFYCDWSANGYRLPTEGEWEYFCRAGTTGSFSVDEPYYTSCDPYCWEGALPNLERVAWYCANRYDLAGNNTAKPVGLKAANPWWLFDVHGNIGEWCWDWFGSYPMGRVTDFRGSNSGTHRVMRSGYWNNIPDSLRSGGRGQFTPDNRRYCSGFRLCRSVD